METSIKLNRTYCTDGPKAEKIDAEMGVSRLLSDSDLWKNARPNAEVKPHLVTSIRNNTSSSPYNLRVTGKWTVRNKARKFPTHGAFLWCCFLIFLLSVNTYVFRKLHNQYKECLQAVTVLEDTVKQLEEETRDLHEKLNTLPQNNVPWTHPWSQPATELPFDLQVGRSLDSRSELIRTKRSNDDARSDRKERKKKTVAVQFSGSRPYGFYMVPPEGILGPWVESANDFSNVEKFGAKLRDHNSSLEINKDGMYMIYAQVTYQSINVSNSFSINVIPNTDRLLSQPITTCSSFGKIVRDGEISCYTSVVKLLNAGDIVFVQQAQPDREIIFTKTYTYFGLIYLN